VPTVVGEEPPGRYLTPIVVQRGSGFSTALVLFAIVPHR
jgi:hypothetical protein